MDNSGSDSFVLQGSSNCPKGADVKAALSCAAYRFTPDHTLEALEHPWLVRHQPEPVPIAEARAEAKFCKKEMEGAKDTGISK